MLILFPKALVIMSASCSSEAVYFVSMIFFFLYLVPYKVTINFNVLCLFKKNEISGYLNCSFVVTVERSGLKVPKTKVLEKVPDPNDFSYCYHHASILCFCRGSCHNMFFFFFAFQDINDSPNLM